VTAIVVMAVGVWWTRRQVSLADVAPAEPPTASARASASASARASERPDAAAEAPSPDPGASGAAAPAPSGSASVSASASASGAAAAAEDPRDGKALPPNRGLLRVRFESAPDAQVFMPDKPVGAVGQKLDVPCGRSFVRVGRVPGPKWLSQGQSVYVQCRLVTDITLPPM
jgi:hypothetical protein